MEGGIPVRLRFREVGGSPDIRKIPYTLLMYVMMSRVLPTRPPWQWMRTATETDEILIIYPSNSLSPSPPEQPTLQISIRCLILMDMLLGAQLNKVHPTVSRTVSAISLRQSPAVSEWEVMRPTVICPTTFGHMVPPSLLEVAQVKVPKLMLHGCIIRCKETPS